MSEEELAAIEVVVSEPEASRFARVEWRAEEWEEFRCAVVRLLTETRRLKARVAELEHQQVEEAVR